VFLRILVILGLGMGTATARSADAQPGQQAERIVVRQPVRLLGREFTGAYEGTPQALDSIRREAAQFGLPIDTLAAASRYLSEPDRTPAAKRRAFHGFVSGATAAAGRLLLLTLSAGEYVVARTADPAMIPRLHSMAAAYAEREQIVVGDDPSTLLSTASGGRPLFTLYLGPIRMPSGPGDGGVRQPPPSAMRSVSTLAGTWMVLFRGRPTPRDTFSTSLTSSVITPLLGGRFLQERAAMPLPNGAAINLIGLLGYDQFRQRYRFGWLDDAYALFDVHEGTWQQNRLVVNNLRSRSTLLDGGREVYSQMVWRDLTPDTFVAESQASVDSGVTWFTQAEALYVRTGPACDSPGSAADTLTIRALEAEGARSNVSGMPITRAREFFASDFRAQQPDGSVSDLPALLAGYRNGRSIPWASRFEISALSVHVYCNIAHVIGRAEAHALAMPPTLPPLRFQWLNVWRRDGTQWRYLYNRHLVSGPRRP
jgi:hypothetical protein